MEAWLIIVIHQIVFQGMFVTKNMVLKRKINKKIRGKNREATRAIWVFFVFITLSIVIGKGYLSAGEIAILSPFYAAMIALALLFFNLLISVMSLIDLKDSWRVGVLENEKTDLVTRGIYRFSRNPYFLSYLLMFAAYTVILQNAILLGLSVFGFLFIHNMILKEEAYLHSTHGDDYLQYKNNVPRYFLI